MTCYLESIAPHDYPGGGGFSICNYSLFMLYQENLICNNYWTVGTENMPLIRYLGCTITLYTQQEVDYLFYYNNNYPMKASKLTYMSTQPHIMLQTKKVKVMKCRKNSKYKKPYKRFFVKPPSQMENRWYFQHDLALQPLLQTMCTACSLDRTYLHANAISSTIGFTSLDTNEIQNHDFTSPSTTGYKPVGNERLFYLLNADPKQYTNYKLEDCTFLGQTEKFDIGTQIKHISNTNKLQTALTQLGYQGNPFHKECLNPDSCILKTTLTNEELISKYGAAGNTKNLDKADFQLKTHYLKHCRYNPFADKGKGNKIYILKITTSTHSHDWTPPEDETLIWEDLPLWLLTWGYLDFQKKCGTQSLIDTNSVCVIQSPYITPLTNKLFVPLDYNFTIGQSPYDTHMIAADQLHWHPCVRHQTQTINLIATTGPNTVKLPENISCEAHLTYKFHFKIGGEPAPMSVLVNPTDQPKYDIPSNLLQTTSLQNPTMPIEYYLSKFDERRGELTKKAIERIKTDWETEKTLFAITDPSTQCPTTSKKATETSDTSSTSEEEETPLETQLNHERRKQRVLRKRINNLLKQLTTSE